MSVITVSSLEIEFTDIGDLSTDDLFAGYGGDLMRDFDQNERTIEVKDIEESVQKADVIISVSGQFNTLGISIKIQGNKDKVEIFKCAFQDLITPDKMEEALTALEKQCIAFKSSDDDQFVTSDALRTKTHTAITDELHGKLDKEIPGLLQNHSDARNLAGIIRGLVYEMGGPY